MSKNIISVTEFNTYSQNFEDTDEVNALKLQILKAAQSVVEEYLNYKFENGNYIEEYTSVGMKNLYLKNIPIENVFSVYIDGEEISDELYEIKDDDHIHFITAPEEDSEIVVEYIGGSDKPNDLIKMTILRIATLMLAECGENIAVTSKSFDGNTRTFMNYTNYDKFLTPLKKYRVFKI